MNIVKYTETQRELNQILDTTPTDNQLTMALIAEVGELSQSLKFGTLPTTNHLDVFEEPWCWWKREDTRGSEPIEVLGEAVDVLHFILTGIIYRYPHDMIDSSIKEMVYRTVADIREFDVAGDVSYYLVSIVKSTDPIHQLYFWIKLVHLLGFDTWDVDAAFERSVAKNVGRWK